MKKILLIALSCFFLTGLSAQTDTNYKEKHPYKDWVKIAPKFDAGSHPHCRQCITVSANYRRMA